jgi:hypothetical protein
MAAIVQVMDSVNWSVVNTTLLLAALGFMWRQSQGVSELKQIMFGAKGAKGLLARVEVMEAAVRPPRGTGRGFTGGTGNLGPIRAPHGARD